jgi:hypothetical protein
MQYAVLESARSRSRSDAHVRVSSHEACPPVVQSIAQNGIVPASGTASEMHFPVHDEGATPVDATLVDGSIHESFGALLQAQSAPEKRR